MNITSTTFSSRLLVLFLLALARDAIAQTCSSPVYCKSPEVRYMGMNQALNTYLNATAIKSTVTRNISSCQTLCLRENGCFSINLNISKANEYGCHLLAGNMYTSPNLLVENRDFIHLFVEVSYQRLQYCSSSNKLFVNIQTFWIFTFCS